MELLQVLRPRRPRRHDTDPPLEPEVQPHQQHRHQQHRHQQHRHQQHRHQHHRPTQDVAHQGQR